MTNLLKNVVFSKIGFRGTRVLRYTEYGQKISGGDRTITISRDVTNQVFDITPKTGNPKNRKRNSSNNVFTIKSDVYKLLQNVFEGKAKVSDLPFDVVSSHINF